MDAETDQGKWFQKIHCLFFSSVSWINCPTKCGCLNKNAQVLVRGAHSQPKPLKPDVFMRFVSFVALNLLFPWGLTWLASGSVCFKWLSADFDRLIQKKRRNDYAWLPKRVVSKNWSQLSCGTLHFESIWHVPLACFYLRTPKEKRTGRVVDRSCWNNPRPR